MSCQTFLGWRKVIGPPIKIPETNPPAAKASSRNRCDQLTWSRRILVMTAIAATAAGYFETRQVPPPVRLTQHFSKLIRSGSIRFARKNKGRAEQRKRRRYRRSQSRRESQVRDRSQLEALPAGQPDDSQAVLR